MPPTFLVFVFVMLYAPLFIFVLGAAALAEFTRFKAYSASILGTYFVFPICLGASAILSLPVFLLAVLGAAYSEKLLSESGAYYVSVVLISSAAMFFIALAAFTSMRYCRKVWSYCSNRWPNGLFG
jgi:hypothetical protein